MRRALNAVTTVDASRSRRGTETIGLGFAACTGAGGQPAPFSAARRVVASSAFLAKIASAPNSSNAESAVSFPTPAIQLIELSKRDAVDDNSIRGPKKLSSGAAAAFQPALIGVNLS